MRPALATFKMAERNISYEDRVVVIVSGRPGAGKTTLAEQLAPALRIPLLRKDVFKETLHDVLERQDNDPFRHSSIMGNASMMLMWRLASDFPAVMLESNFRYDNRFEQEKLLSLSDSIVEVYCRVSAEVAQARFRARNSDPDCHPVHCSSEMPLDWFDQFKAPMGLGPVIEVDTTRAVDVDQLASELRGLLPGRPRLDRGVDGHQIRRS